MEKNIHVLLPPQDRYSCGEKVLRQDMVKVLLSSNQSFSKISAPRVSSVLVQIFYHTACVTKAGEIFTWGCGCFGRLGHGNWRGQYTPKRVETLIGVKVKMVSCGEDHTAVCTEDGHMYTFGKGKHGQLGHGDKENKTSPALVHALEGKCITQVQCGHNYTMALTSSGYTFTWGETENGRLGHANPKLRCCSIPCLVKGLSEHNVVQISSDNEHCAVLTDPDNLSPIRQSQQISFNNKKHSNVVFMIDTVPLYANIEVLSQKSIYFAAMFRSNMRESIERVVKVPNFSKEAFLRLLEYMCLDDFTLSVDNAVEQWQLADFYQLEGLKISCMGSLERGLHENNVSQILQEAEDLSCPCDGLKRMCHEFLGTDYEDYNSIDDSMDDSMDDEDY